MLVACWSVKGGSGTTVAAASIALALARHRPGGVTFADLGGDAAAVFGIPEPIGPGLGEWAGAGDDVPAAALSGLRSRVRDGLHLLHRGDGPIGPIAGERMAVALASLGCAVVDCGQLTAGCPAAEGVVTLASAATHSLLVMRPCFLTLRRALAAPISPSGVVLVKDQPRALSRADVEDVLGVPVRAEVHWDPAVARAVDAGLFATSPPSQLLKSLRDAA